MEPNHGLSRLKIALLIDFDNVILGIDDPGFDVELVVNALRERGSIVMGRCYGDWYRHSRHRRKLMEQGLELVETPAFGPVIKNSADIRIALDGFEIAMTQDHIDTFCLVSGDSDFLPLIKKLQYLGKQVLVICGAKFTSDMLRRNCNEFISYENLLAESVGAEEDATTLDGSFALLKRAIDALHERGSEVRSSTVKQMMLQLNPVFSERNFGCSQFKQFLDKGAVAGLIKLGGRDRTSGEFFVLFPDAEMSHNGGHAPEIAAAQPNAPVAPLENAPAETPYSRRRRGREYGREMPPRAETAPQPTLATPQIAAPLAASVVPPLTPPATPQAPGTDLFVPATSDDTEGHGITTSALLGRGLRRGRLKFSGKSGRPEVAVEENPTPATDALAEPTPDAETLQAALEEAADALEGTLEMTPPSEPAAPLELGTPVPGLAREDGTIHASDSELSQSPEASEAAPKKTRSRRRRKTTDGAANEKSVAETAPASDEEAARNLANVEAAGLTFPGKAFEITETPAPVEEASVATASDAPSNEEKPAKKPTRRRSPRKKADAPAE